MPWPGKVPTPGEVSRAHHAVRWLDELPECRCQVLEVLCQPLRRVSYTYNLTGVLNANVLALCAACVVVTYVRSHTRDMSGVSGFVRHASATSANYSLKLECV